MYSQEQETSNNNNYKNTLNEEIRIRREKKCNLSKILPIIFQQEIRKLKILSDETILQLKTQLINELNNDVNTFVSNYLNGEYRIELNDTNYTGLAMIKLKEDTNNSEYVYIGCLVKMGICSINQNFGQIQKK
eukprot:UN11679